MDCISCRLAILDAKKSRFEPGAKIGLVLRAAGENDFVEAVEALYDMGRSHFFAGEDAQFSRLISMQPRDEDALVGDDVPRVTRARAEVDRIDEKTPAREDEWQAQERDEFPPALERRVFADAARAVIPVRAENGPRHAVENGGESSQHKDVGTRSGVPEDFLTGGKGGCDLRRHDGVLDRINKINGIGEGN